MSTHSLSSVYVVGITGVFSWTNKSDISVSGCLSLLPGDLMQLYKNCKHGGPGSHANCHQCTMTAHHRLDTDVDVMDHSRIRSCTHTDLCLDQAILESTNAKK